jgi:hypothetical protein
MNKWTMVFVILKFDTPKKNARKEREKKIKIIICKYAFVSHMSLTVSYTKSCEHEIK